MAKGKNATVGVEAGERGPAARSVAVASGGIYTADDAANFLSALIGDVMTGAVPEKTANSACGAMRGLLRVVDMKERYANRKDRPGSGSLRIAEPTSEAKSIGPVKRKAVTAKASG